MSDKVYSKGIYYNPPHEKAPSYVLGKLRIKKEEAIDWLKSMPGEWVNLDIKQGKEKPYLQVNDWKPKQEGTETKPEQGEDDEPPF